MLEGLEQRWVPSTVTNNNDSGSGSLRAAIASAHNNETIVFASSLNGQTITLTSGELLIKKGLTISGPGASLLTISGNNLSRVFDVTSPAVQQVTLNGLTLENGVGGGNYNQGGGIENTGTLTINNCTITNCSAGQGGGIDNQAGATLTVNNSTVSNITSGGGINNYGTLTVSASTLSGNQGGGITNNYASTLTVTNSTLSGNVGFNGVGGGIYNLGTATVSNSTLSGNSGQGGAIRNDDNGSLTVSGCTLSGNTGTNGGGGIWVLSGTVTVSGSTLTGNSAGPLGGGGILIYGGTLTLTNDTMGSNTTTGHGGGIYIAAGANVSLDSFTVANIINNTDSSGLNGSTANIDGSYTLLH
jgi:hypothetical protein